MRKVTFLLLSCCSAVIVLGFSQVDNVGANEPHKRCKRRVLFTTGSKMFIRINGKENVIPYTTVFSHGWGFRINWDLPKTLPRRHVLFKRELQEDIEDYMNFPGLEGFSCVLKYICETVQGVKIDKESCGIFCEIGKIISRSQGWDAYFLRSFLDKCDKFITKCPYQLSSTKTVTKY